ncbi:hypothetical protein [Sediminicola arcticus]|jgi:hypothetical protein|uniref:Uncharacterized protein n=1 Tax=Sediminicola arcticus TaxID=1574308 RepID=A0ABV2SRY0_9FLAO
MNLQMNLSRSMWVTTLFTFCFSCLVMAQVPRKEFKANSLDTTMNAKFLVNKEMPTEITDQVVTALSYYPELKDVKVEFRFRKSKTPFSSKPTFFSMFKKRENRTYIVTISTDAESINKPLLFLNLPYNAQIGVMGRELGQISTYHSKNTSQLIGNVFKMLNATYAEETKFNKDLICIDHGLGYQLFDWSSYIQGALDLQERRGSTDLFFTQIEPSEHEPSMNPQIIEQYIEATDMYKQVNKD